MVRSVQRFFVEWWGYMSGGISIPIGILALLDAWSQQKLLAVLGYVALWIFVLEQSYKMRQLKQNLKPRLKISCGPDVPDSVPPIVRVPIFSNVGNRAIIGAYSARFYRAYVANLGINPVQKCRAQIRQIEREGKRVWGGGEAILTFAPGEGPDTTAKTISEHAPAYLDILYVQDNEVVLPAVLGRGWNHGPVFNSVGEYIITIVISADEMRDHKFRVAFNWKGNWDESTLVLIPV